MAIQQTVSQSHHGKVEIQDSKIKRISSNKNKNSAHNHAHSAQTYTEIKTDSNISIFPKSKKEKNSLFDKILEFIQSDDAILLLLLVVLFQDGVDDWILFIAIGYLLISDKLV